MDFVRTVIFLLCLVAYTSCQDSLGAEGFCKKYKPGCEETGGKCTIDGDLKLECDCPGNKTYTTDNGCSAEDSFCKKYQPGCEETGGTCALSDDLKLECRCPEKKTYTTAKGCSGNSVLESGPVKEDNTTDTDDISSTKQENSTESAIDTSQDIIITGTAKPGSNATSDIAESSSDESVFTTIFDDFENSTIITVTEEIRTACSLYPCRNGGTCIEDEEVPFLFSCSCPSGYVGIRCGTVDKCATNKDGEVCKNGACAYSRDGLTRSCKCFIGTYWDDRSKECKDPDPPCFPNPCMNGGTCNYEEDMLSCECPSNYGGTNCSVLNRCGDCSRGTCVQLRTTKYCRCNEGLYWSEEKQACEEITSVCDLSPCMNGGICEATSDKEYNCTCEKGFSGTVCEIMELCDSDQHCGGGRCILSENNKTRSCHCNNGYYLEEYFHTCEKITNICEPNPCLNDGICTVVSAASFNCTCSEGYRGKTCNVRDLCKMDGGDDYCGNGICGSNYELGVYFCTCKGNEYFQYTERKCVELDMCPLMQCESTQKCLQGRCECKDQYKWNNVTMKCAPDFCSWNPCPDPEMICVEGTGSTDYKCRCKEGQAFNGTHCNEASCSFPNLNSCNQYCSWKDDAYECSCADDFELKEDNRTCTYIGNSTCSNKTCDKGLCVKRDDLEICICPPGFTEINGTCKDICSAGLLPSGVCPSEECETTDRGFRCKCYGKFTFSQDKTTCMVRNVCQKNEIGWKACTELNAECETDWLQKDGFKCVCAVGQVKGEGGICRDICSIENNQRLCSSKGATCELNRKGQKICKCPPYFKANERDGKCTQPAEYSFLITLPLDKSAYVTGKRQKRSLDPSADYRKILKDVTVTMREMFTGFSQASVISCKSMTAYLLCKIELQFSIEPGKGLKRLETNDVCLSNGNSNECLLPPSLVLVKNRINEIVKIQSTDPCDDDIKEKVCGSETSCVSSLPHKSFNCSCKTGYFTRGKNYQFGNTQSFIEMCTDVDECALGDPCPANSICENTVGSYLCSCKSGYRRENALGSNSLKCVELCYPNPCTHGECSSRGAHEFDCKCDAGYRGAVCNLHDENFKRARTNTIIVGVVLGGVLLITFILFAACISRLKKQKSLENSSQMLYSAAEMTERRRVEGGAVNNAFRRD